MRQNLRKYYTRLVAICMAALLLLGSIPSASAAELSGTCGKNLNWSFSDGRLTITGSGDMTDYNQVDTAPWYSFREQILYLSLPDGLTSVGNMAFFDCVNLTAVTIPNSVTDIGKLAFCQCYNISILNLNSGLVSIGRSAFEQCKKLQDLRLPDTLTTLGYHAFYDCEQLRYVTIPASVTNMDSGVFAYCTSLVRADIEASLAVVPSWTFYGCGSLTTIVLHQDTVGTDENAFVGCEKLTTVYYAGTEENAQQIRDQIADDSESFDYFGSVTDAEPDDSASFESVTEGENGETITTNTNVSKTEDATIHTTGSTTTTVENEQSAAMDVTATLFTEEGWAQLWEAIEAAQRELQNQTNQGMTSGGVNVDVYLPDNSGVPTEVLDKVVGTNVELTVQTQDGSKFTVNGSTLESTKEEGKVAFSYTLTQMAEVDFEALNGVAAYKLQFTSSSAVRVEVMIRLPAEYARNTATLYEVSGNKLLILQSVIVDTMGYAHFYLANVDAEQSYRIGINIPGIDQDSVIVPDELHNEFGITATYFDITQQYVITGQTSSWGMSMNQVTKILIAVMAGCVVCVGVVMYVLNRRKLKKGYVPDISEEDWEE